MKFSFIASALIILLVAGCGKKEETKLTAYNSEAFAYDIGGSWEVNATTRIKGFKQEEENGKYKATLSYDLDIVTPQNDTLKSIISKVSDKIENEKMSDTSLEAQFDLDSTYASGEYKIIFNVKDAATGASAVTFAAFKLSKE